MNLFKVPQELPPAEIFDKLIPDQGVLIERIISSGQATPEGEWYDQERDEWVVLLQGRAELGWKDGSRQELAAGDWRLIPAHELHRVVWTSQEPPCIWLAVHGQLR